MRLEKCLHSMTYLAMRNGKYDKNEVLVFYGFNTYKRTVEHIHNIVMAIKEDFPDMSITDMEIYEITKVQSNRRAGQTMICVYADTEAVRNNLTDFMEL